MTDIEGFELSPETVDAIREDIERGQCGGRKDEDAGAAVLVLVPLTGNRALLGVDPRVTSETREGFADAQPIAPETLFSTSALGGKAKEPTGGVPGGTVTQKCCFWFGAGDGLWKIEYDC